MHTLLAKSRVVIPVLWSASLTDHEGTSYRLPICTITCEPLSGLSKTLKLLKPVLICKALRALG